jgi:hypothetical protein
MMDQTFFLEKPLLKDIKPSGFYRRQLEYCASGLTGNIEKYFSDLGQNNAWKGGSGDAWERGPYYLDGLVSLAFLLKNDSIIRSDGCLDQTHNRFIQARRLLRTKAKRRRLAPPCGIESAKDLSRESPRPGIDSADP